MNPPKLLAQILARTDEIKFGLASDKLTGSLLLFPILYFGIEALT